jgi:hypothetical protein
MPLSRARRMLHGKLASSSASAPTACSAALLDVASSVEREVRNEPRPDQEDDCDEYVHGYSFSKFAIADWIRLCSE